MTQLFLNTGKDRGPGMGSDSRRLALTASVIQRPKEFPKVKWRRLGMVDLQVTFKIWVQLAVIG